MKLVALFIALLAFSSSARAADRAVHAKLIVDVDGKSIDGTLNGILEVKGSEVILWGVGIRSRPPITIQINNESFWIKGESANTPNLICQALGYQSGVDILLGATEPGTRQAEAMFSSYDPSSQGSQKYLKRVFLSREPTYEGYTYLSAVKCCSSATCVNENAGN